jgi:hypothetical protein
LAGGGEIAREAQRGEGIGFAGGDFGRRPAVEELAEQRNEPEHERRIGVDAELAAAVRQRADQVHARDAAADQLGVRALVRGERRVFLGAVDDHGEAFLGVVDDQQVVDQLLLFFGQRHERRAAKKRRKHKGILVAGRFSTTQPGHWALQSRPNESLLEARDFVMSDTVPIPLSGFSLPGDFPWRVGFVALVDQQLRRLRGTGHFLPPRFFGYYFRGDLPIAVGGAWTVSLDAVPPITLLPEVVEPLIAGPAGFVSLSRETAPAFMLVHDTHDGACWLWTFAEAVEFIQAFEPVTKIPGGLDPVVKPGDLGP